MIIKFESLIHIHKEIILGRNSLKYNAIPRELWVKEGRISCRIFKISNFTAGAILPGNQTENYSLSIKSSDIFSVTQYLIRHSRIRFCHRSNCKPKRGFRDWIHVLVFLPFHTQEKTFVTWISSSTLRPF